MTATSTPTITFVDDGATAHTVGPATTVDDGPDQRAGVGAVRPIGEPPDVPAGDEAEGGDEGDVVEELRDVAAPAVVQQAADTFGRGQRPEHQEHRTQPPADHQDDDDRTDGGVRQRRPGVDVLVEEPRVAHLAIRDLLLRRRMRCRGSDHRCSFRSSQRMAK